MIGGAAIAGIAGKAIEGITKGGKKEKAEEGENENPIGKIMETVGSLAGGATDIAGLAGGAEGGGEGAGGGIESVASNLLG